MIKFFRIIRQKLVQENKVSKYMLYAVGEIVLVIIGILIALSLNKANEAKIQEKKIEAILEQIQTELVATIETANRTIEHFRGRDSVINLVMNRKVTKADYRNPENFRLRSLFGSPILIMQDEGFNSLMLKSEVLPDKYTILVNGLKGFYIIGKESIEFQNNLADEARFKAQDHLSTNTDWFGEYDYFGGNIPDDAVDYYLNNLNYRKSLSYTSRLITDALGEIIYTRIRAIEHIREIDLLLEADNTYEFDININDYSAWISKYHSEGDTIQIDSHDGDLTMSRNSVGPPHKIYPLTSISFHIPVNYYYVFHKDEQGEIIGHTASRGSYRRYWEKIK